MATGVCMREVYKLLALFFLVLCLNESTSNAIRHRRMRCIPRLCRMCDLYIHSRWRRSLPDEEEPVSTLPDEDQRDLSEEPELDSAEDAYPQEPRTDNPLRQRPPAKFDVEPEDDVITTPPQQHKQAPRTKPRSQQPPQQRQRAPRLPHKRSVHSYTRRCLTLLRTPCCKRYGNVPMYIGYHRYRLRN